MGSHIFGTFTFLKLNFETPLLIPSFRGALTYKRFFRLTFNTQGVDTYLNEVVYAERQIMLEVFVQAVYNLGNCIPAGIVKLKFVGNEIINRGRAVPEASIFNKCF